MELKQFLLRIAVIVEGRAVCREYRFIRGVKDEKRDRALVKEEPVLLLGFPQGGLGAMAVKGHLYRDVELPLAEGLEDVAVGLRDLGPLHDLLVSVGRKVDNGDGVVEPYLLRGGHAVHLSAELYVHQDDVRAVLKGKHHRLLSGGDDVQHIVAQGLELVLQAQGNDALVLDYEHTCKFI